MNKNKLLVVIAQGMLLLPLVSAAGQPGQWNCTAGANGWECAGGPGDNTAQSEVATDIAPKSATNAQKTKDTVVATEESSANTTTAPLPRPETVSSAKQASVAKGKQPTTPAKPAVSSVATAKKATKTAQRTEQKSAAKAKTPTRQNKAKVSALQKKTSQPAPIDRSEKTQYQPAPRIASYSHGNRLAKLDEGLSWDRCASPLVGGSQPSRVGDRDTHVSSDSVSYTKNDNVAIFGGNVEVVQGDQHVEADWVRYSRNNRKAEAGGSLFYKTPSLRMVADRGEFYLSENRGRLDKIRGYRLTESGARGAADEAVVHDSKRSSYRNISYTTCKPGNEDWMLSADKLDVDMESGWAEARNTTLRFKGAPILYSPYFSFPVDDRRMSGFLAPKISVREETGLDVTAPYYLNLAPNYDATLYPRVMSERGLMLGGEFRFLTEESEGILGAEILPDDQGNDPDEDDTRGSFSVRYRGKPAERWSTNLHLDYASDSDYYSDFGSNIGITSARHLERTASARYSGDYWGFSSLVQDYQTIDNTIASADRPYSRLPQLLLTANVPDENLGLNYHWYSEYVYFYRQGRVHGQRVDLMPGVSYPVRRLWGHIVPKVSARYTAYDLEEQGTGNPSSPDRFLPIFSLDSGLVFERPTSWFGEGATQTLEPRLFYLYTPDEDQSDLPVFDTTTFASSLDSLFRENRFTGADRQGDANQLTTVLTTRYLSDETGTEWLRASLGQIYYFDDRNVQLPGTAIERDNSSSLVGEVASNFTENWSTRTYLQWDPHSDNVEKGSAELRYNNDNRRVFNVAYRYEDTLQDQFDTSFAWPVDHQWSLVGRWNYSIQDDKTLDALAGVEYDSCCWAFRFAARHFANDTDSYDSTTGIFLQLELKGLGSLGHSADKVMEEGVLGYRVKH